MTKKVLCITGASRDFGRIWTEAALARGDQVAATARDVKGVSDLTERYGNAALPIPLDVTEADQVSHAVARAQARFGRLDVVVDNAGYALLGAIEETPEVEDRAEFETNVFGALRVIQTGLPYLRAQGRGHILVPKEFGAVVSGLPMLSMTPKKATAVLAGAFAKMRPDGRSIQFTYGPRCPVPQPILDSLGLEVKREGRALLNCPPATVYSFARHNHFAQLRSFRPTSDAVQSKASL